LSTVRADIVRRAWKAPRRSTERVDAYVARWIEQRHGLKGTTRALYRNVFAGTIQHTAIGVLPLSEVTPDLVRTWHHDHGLAKRAELAAGRKRAEQRGRVYSQATRTGAALVRQAFLLLRAALATAVSDGLMEANPCSSIKGASQAWGSGRFCRPPKCGSWPRLSTRDIAHWCCWQRSRDCGSANSPRYAAATWTTGRPGPPSAESVALL
jgi:hypothetical protein